VVTERTMRGQDDEKATQQKADDEERGEESHSPFSSIASLKRG
jgi:hypothetical protein